MSDTRDTDLPTTLIAHRGNFRGKSADAENSPDYIDIALASGFHAELDVWVVNGKILLGHHKPEWEVDLDWLIERKDLLWVHCKNLDCTAMASNAGLHWFFHDSDQITLTSKGYIWAFPGVIVPHPFVYLTFENKWTLPKAPVIAVCADRFE